jgi:hypothetical protein
MNILPTGWALETMSEIQMSFVRHWIERKKLAERRSLGELLGVYWTAERFYGAQRGDGPAKKHDEVFLPLAGILNPDVLNKTLEKTLMHPGTDDSNMPNTFDLSSLPFKDYQDFFKQVPPDVIPPEVR